jgi:hypothetical protein
MLIDGGGGPAARPAPIPRFRKTKLMVRQLHPPVVLLVLLAVAGYGQTPQPPAAGYSRIYILLKPAVAEPGAARDAFAQRLAAFGVINLQFVSGANAARCEAPAAAQANIGADADVSAVLPMDAIPLPAPAPPVAPPPVQGPMISTPPYIPPQLPMPISAGVPVGGGMSAGMVMLTDFAGNMVVKLLTPRSSCKIRLHGPAAAIPARGGGGAFEVKASGNCAWQAVSTADWLRVKNDVNAAGSVAVAFSAAGNSGAQRQAVIVIQPVAGMGPLNGHTVMVVAQQ